MLGNFLIGLREGLEAALVVGILVAYVVKINRRDVLPRLWLGITAAVLLSLGVGAALTYGSRGLTFEAQEAFGGFMSIFAVGLVTWMIFWMAKAARTIKGELESNIDKALTASAMGLVVVGFISVGREGIETALFIWAAVQSSGSTTAPLIGAALGLAVAVFLGYLVYRGAVKLNLSTFFKWTGAALIVVAAGVLAYGVHDLQEAGILPGLHNLAFDVSQQVPPSSWYGTVLKAVFNFSPATTMLEAIVWVAYIVPTMTLFWMRVNGKKKPPAASVVVTETQTSTTAVTGDVNAR